MISFGDPRLPDRFWSKCAPEPNSGCWLWTASTTLDLYGHIRIAGVLIKAHRLAFEALVAPLDEGLVIDHLCRTPSCVNPAHMEPVTPGENTLRGESFTARQARQTHCKYGHALSGDNLHLYERKSGHFMRTCRTCNERIQRARWGSAV